MTPRKRPADHVRVPLSAERNERMWRRLEADLGRPRRPSWVAPVALIAVAAAVAFLGLATRRPPPSAPRIARDEVRPVAEGVALPDGSRLRPGQGARTAVIVASRSEIRVRLIQGSASLEVTRDEGRSFVLEAGPAEVRADGARFRAELAGDPLLLSLTVAEGAVSVVSPAGQPLASLQAGQSWTLRSVDPAPSGSAPPRRVESPPSRPAPSAPRPAEPEPPRNPAAEPEPPRSTETDTSTSPRALFARADAARLDGRTGEAARHLERLCTSFPGDARAGVAAFQLGRLKLREMGDPGGAVRWLRVALDHPSAGAYREDAAADLVEALDRAGQLAGCQKARDSFASAHPSSVRLAAVLRRCAPR
jgi:hypothetical protein